MVRKVGLTDSVGFACLEDLQLSNSYMWGTAISLDYCGREDCIKGWKFGPYVRESYVIHIVKKAKGYSLYAVRVMSWRRDRLSSSGRGKKPYTRRMMMILGVICG